MEVEELVDLWLLAQILEKKRVPKFTAVRFLRLYIDRQ